MNKARQECVLKSMAMRRVFDGAKSIDDTALSRTFWDVHSYMAYIYTLVRWARLPALMASHRALRP